MQKMEKKYARAQNIYLGMEAKKLKLREQRELLGAGGQVGLVPIDQLVSDHLCS